MTTVDPRTPVIVGAGQITSRERGAEPIDLMSRCAELALDDASTTGLRATVDAVRVVWGVWPYRDPGRLIADRIGTPAARSTITPMGGNQVYDLVIDTAARLQRGEIDTAVLCAAETLRTRRADHKAGVRSQYLPEREGATSDEMLGVERPLSTAAEDAYGLGVATTFYAMAETALRHRTGEAVEAHRRRIAELWARASDVAATNPDAWLRDPVTADTIATVTDRNRPVAAPYPKLMVSNVDVDQGGSIVMTTVERAEALGVPRERWVFPWAGVGAHDHYHMTNRWAFDESPAMRLAGTRTLELAGTDVDECAFVDLYSCFPVAVQVAQRELAIDAQRPFTITGGLTFGGGPLNCYCILPLTRAVHLLRDAPTERAFLTGNGGWFTKHSMLVVSATPSAHGFRTASVQAETDALPRRTTPTAPVDRARVETYTVTYDRSGAPNQALVACLADDATRHFAVATDSSVIDELLAGDACDRTVGLAPEPDGHRNSVRELI